MVIANCAIKQTPEKYTQCCRVWRGCHPTRQTDRNSKAISRSAWYACWRPIESGVWVDVQTAICSRCAQWCDGVSQQSSAEMLSLLPITLFSSLRRC